MLLPDHDLVQGGDQEGWNDEHGDGHVAEGERRHDGGGVAEHQGGRDRTPLPRHQGPHRGEAGPRAQRGGERERHVCRGHGTVGPRDRRQDGTDQRARRVGEQVGPLRHVDGPGEEEGMEVTDGPGGPGHEPDLLRRVAAAAGERGRGVARPHVPPQNDGGHGEAGQGHEVETDGPEEPAGGAASLRPRRGVVCLRIRGRSLLLRRTGRDVVHRVHRHLHPTRHRRRAYCRAPRAGIHHHAAFL